MLRRSGRRAIFSMVARGRESEKAMRSLVRSRYYVQVPLTQT